MITPQQRKKCYRPWKKEKAELLVKYRIKLQAAFKRLQPSKPLMINEGSLRLFIYVIIYYYFQQNFYVSLSRSETEYLMVAALSIIDTLPLTTKEKESLEKAALSLPLDIAEFFITQEYVKRIDIIGKITAALYTLTNYAPFNDKLTIAQLKRNCYARKRRASAFSVTSISKPRKRNWSSVDEFAMKTISAKLKNCAEKELTEQIRKSA